jgi:anti-anti-sigma factor
VFEVEPESPESGLEVRWPAKDVALVTLSGEHDLGNAATLQDGLDDALRSCSHLIVDISPTTFIDSSTVNALVQAKKHADERRCRFNLVLGTTPIIERTLEICGVLPALNRVATVDQALSAAEPA